MTRVIDRQTDRQTENSIIFPGTGGYLDKKPGFCPPAKEYGTDIQVSKLQNFFSVVIVVVVVVSMLFLTYR